MQDEADAILKSALDLLRIPPDERAGFAVTDRGEFLIVTVPDGEPIEIDIEERYLNEGGYVTAVVRELENRGFGRRT